MPSKKELLDEKDKLQFKYWKLKEDRAKIYHTKMEIHSKLLSVSRKISDIENRILVIIREFNE